MAPGGRLDVARVQFYAAEIILALAHLHDLGLMYRDLKVYTISKMENGRGFVSVPQYICQIGRLERAQLLAYGAD